MSCGSKVQHLQMIEKVIERLAGNSSQLKRWCVALVAGAVALSLADGFKFVIPATWALVLLMWALDSMYLRDERRYRLLYDEVRLKGEGEIDFSMDVRRIGDRSTEAMQCFLSRTECWFYSGILVWTVALFLFASAF